MKHEKPKQRADVRHTEHWEKPVCISPNSHHERHKIPGFEFDAMPAKDRATTYVKVNDTDY